MAVVVVVIQERATQVDLHAIGHASTVPPRSITCRELVLGAIDFQEVVSQLLFILIPNASSLLQLQDLSRK